ncbi:hypothetical protein TMatcc_003816 [Talaromyces marneffei ATCC 18224]|uniref:Uncharacterized protein n=2 Tax=Talaromyces marneffei TaxID=37727 RepID=B6Q1L7_TALMQ|nr:uncharacterized protein EYB26_001180 [Talaromyces marneffei]EEA27883.1 hypothetical protein PMAA_027230 [Talaromyces marneffei ATCC 18224]KAE8556452.1 hypothetical protein EYB25_001153 [Talaromyces marneffei]QGA13530.1 hypothetical protein EYB26_001180 [Talaromyces marneffei]
MSQAAGVAFDPTSNQIVEDLTDAEYGFLLNQAIGLETIPNDIRVWDRYLFSKCTTAIQAWCLVQIYVILRMLKVDFIIVGQWCKQGNFVEKALYKSRESPVLVEKFARLNLNPIELIEQNRNAFSRPRGFIDTSALNKPQIQKKWLEQAMQCARSRLAGNELDGLDMQKAYFALGMIVFQMRPSPEYLWVNKTIDIWYDMGFAVVFDPDGPTYLQGMYESIFRKDFGIPFQSFAKFYEHWTRGTFAQSFEDCVQTRETSQRKFKLWVELWPFEDLKGFHKARAEKREESVWRLRQLLDSNIENKKEDFLGPGKELLKAWKDYGICPGDWAYQRAKKNKFTIDKYTQKRKQLYQNLLNAKKDPKELHWAMEANSIRDYVKETLSLPAEDVIFLP